MTQPGSGEQYGMPTGAVWGQEQAPRGGYPYPGGYPAPSPPPVGTYPPYGPPYGGYPYAPARTNGMAIASLVLGILWLYWIGSILALVLGYTAKRQIRERGEAGSGMATAGIVLGWIGVGFFGLTVLLAVASAGY